MTTIQTIKDIWFLISSVAIPVATFFYGKIKAQQEEMKLVKDSLCSLMRNSILKSCNDYLSLGHATIEEKETLNQLYINYHKCGGNSFITDMVEQVNKLSNK